MKKRILSLALALALCLGLSVPAMAADLSCNPYIKFSQEPIGWVLEKGEREWDDEPYETVCLLLKDGTEYSWNCPEGTEIYISASYDMWNVNGTGSDSFDNDEGYLLQFPGGQLSCMTESYADLCRENGTTIEALNSEEVSNSGNLVAPWARETVNAAVKAGLLGSELVLGSELAGETDFRSGMTRAQFAAVAVGLYAGLGGQDIPERDSLEYSSPFTDVHYYEKDTNSDDNSFIFSGSVQRRWDPYEREILQAYALGFVSGTGETTFSPNATLTREQAAVMLSKVYAKLRGDIPQTASTSFADDASVASWAKSAVAFMAEKGFVSGVGDNQFAPQKTLSIQEAVVIAQGMLEKLK